MTRHRSARTGKFVTAKAAKRAPATTVKERRTRSEEIEKAAREFLRAHEAFFEPGVPLGERSRRATARIRKASALSAALARKE